MLWQKSLRFKRVQHWMQNTRRACVRDVGAGDIRYHNHRSFVCRCFCRTCGSDHLRQWRCPTWGEEGLRNGTGGVGKRGGRMWYGKESCTRWHVKHNGRDISVDTQGRRCRHDGSSPGETLLDTMLETMSRPLLLYWPE